MRHAVMFQTFALVSLVGAVSGCGKDQDTAALGDDTDGGDTVPQHLAEGYDHVNQIHISPNETGAAWGLTECDIELGATLSVDATGTACPACDDLFRGPITYSVTNCAGASIDGDTISYGLAWESGGIHVWIWDSDAQVWTDEGLATAQGQGSYELVTTELIGDESFNLGDSTLTYRFTAL